MWWWALLALTVLLGIEGAAYFLQPVEDVDATGHKPIIVREFGEGTLIAQTFLVPRDGLHAVTVSLWSGVPATIAFQFHLYRRGEGPSEEVATRDVETSITSGTVRQRIEFPPISPAKDRVFVVRLQLTRAVARDPASAATPEARVPVGLMAWADNPLPTGTLLVADRERWADLDFSAETSPPARLHRMVDAINSTLPPGLRLTFFEALVVLLLFASIVVGVAMLAVAPWALTTGRLAEHLSPTSSHRYGNWTRTVGAIALGLGTPALFMTVLAVRERPVEDLLHELDNAVMDSPAGMHGAFSPWQEGINGSSPPALFAHPPSRITWTVAVPAHKPLLKTNLALRPYVWDKSDGVVFSISAEDGASVTELSSRLVNPRTNFNDRTWVPMDVDLSQYAGRSVRLVFTTSPGPAGDPAWDWALWGDPRIIERR